MGLKMGGGSYCSVSIFMFDGLVFNMEPEIEPSEPDAAQNRLHDMAKEEEARRREESERLSRENRREYEQERREINTRTNAREVDKLRRTIEELTNYGVYQKIKNREHKKRFSELAGYYRQLENQYLQFIQQTKIASNSQGIRLRYFPLLLAQLLG